ncbi:MAG: hypothetical protein LUI05_03450 [Oscillospiraceae bacterium]|nr:hypothetical protein [Oscillospiraceae bacterium]
MDQLLSIKHIPIKIEVNVTSAEFKRREGAASAPEIKVSKNSGGVQLQAQPYKVDISAPRFDSYQTSPVQTNSLTTLTYEGIARLPGSSGEDSAAAGSSSSNIAARSASQSIEAILSKLPKTKSSSVSYNNGTLSINYSMESSGSSESIDLLDLSSGFEFIPGSIEFVVSQMPDLEIEYLGEPIYFPRSADPNYQGEVDVIA